MKNTEKKKIVFDKKIVIAIFSCIAVLSLAIKIANVVRNYNKNIETFIFDGNVYVSTDFNSTYDENNNITEFKDKQDNYHIKYSYSYADNKISQINFKGLYFGIDLEGSIDFEYENNNISKITINSNLNSDKKIDIYTFYYNEDNRVNLIEHEVEDNSRWLDDYPDGKCRYYYYDKYVISDCNFSEVHALNLSKANIVDYYYRAIYVNDPDFQNNTNVWIANNIKPYIYYDIYFNPQITSDVSLIGSNYSAPYNPGNLLYSASSMVKNGISSNNSITKHFYSDGKAIKSVYEGDLKGSFNAIYDNDKLISSIDSLNTGYEFLYIYKNNKLYKKKVSKSDYNKVEKKYNDNFKMSIQDYEINDIISNLDIIIEDKYNEVFAPAPIIEANLQAENTSKEIKYYTSFSTAYTDNLEVYFNDSDILENNNHNESYCSHSFTGEYNCELNLKENSNILKIVASNSVGKETIKEYVINLNAISPSIKIEKDYYRVALNDNQWKPRFTLSDTYSNYNFTFYFDNKSWLKDPTSFFELVDDSNDFTYEVWVGKLGPGTKEPEIGNHIMKIEITDKRTGKKTYDETTIECY